MLFNEKYAGTAPHALTSVIPIIHKNITSRLNFEYK
jgi:hypothetical protein